MAHVDGREAVGTDPLFQRPGDNGHRCGIESAMGNCAVDETAVTYIPDRFTFIGWTHKVEERFMKARVRSHARLAAAWLYACVRSGSKNQCPVPL